MQSQSVMEVGATSVIAGVASSSRRVDASTAQLASHTETDKVEISSKGSYVSDLVQQVKQMPAVRTDVVGSYKAQVESGLFPPPSLIAGFQKLAGLQLASEKRAAAESVE